MTTRKKIRQWFKRNVPWLHAFVSRSNTRQRWYRTWRRAGLPLEDEKKAFSYFKTAQQYNVRERSNLNRKAVHYVGTEPEEGLAQLAALMYHGCKPEHKVLEIGCGSLSAGYPIMQYLNAGNYVGIDPNKWLIDKALEDPRIEKVVDEKNVRFGYSDKFDASEFDTKFDYIISHSILSHAAHWQWPLFMENIDKVLKPGSIVLASLHFIDGNDYGDPPYDGTELDFNEWVYPGTSAFRKSTIFDLAKEKGYSIEIDLVTPRLITYTHPAALHSWIKMKKL